MIKKRFNVPIYCYDCVFLEIESRDDAEALTKELRRLRITDEIMEEVSTSCVEGDVDGGWTIANLGRKIICVVLLPMRSADQRLSVLNHEKRHVVDDILNHCGVDDKEAAAYLDGYVSRYLR